jgi:hypothetical protein
MPAMVMVRFSNEMRPTKAPPVSRAPVQRISMDRLHDRVQNPNVPATIVCYVEHSGRAKAGAGPCHAEAFGIRDPGAKRRFLRKPANEPALQLQASQ